MSRVGRKGLAALLCALALGLPGMAWGQTQLGGQMLGYWYQGLPLTGGTLTGLLLLPDGTAAAPSMAFANRPTYGFYSPSASGISLGLQGTSAFAWDTSIFFKIHSAGGVGWVTGSNAMSDVIDLKLYRDAANTLGLRNAGTAGTPVPQAFNVYNFCDGAACATGYERAGVYWSGNIVYFGQSIAGTGSQRRFILFGSQTNGLELRAGGAADTTGSWLFSFGVPGLAPAVSDVNRLGTPTEGLTNFYLLRSIQGSKSKALTESSASSFVRVAVPQTAAANYGGGSIGYTVYATDGTDSQSLVGDVRFAMVNKAGTETCTVGEVGVPVLAASSATTLTCAFTCSTAAGDTVDVFANCVSSLVQTTFTIQDRGDMQQPNTWTPQ